MKLRVVMLAILFAAVGFLVVRTLPREQGRARMTSAANPGPPLESFTPLSRDSSLQLAAQRERVLAPYRLRPDRRLLLALTEIRHLAGGPDSALTAGFESGRWSVRFGGQPIGGLSELPEFPEMLDLATEWARKQAWSKGWSDDTGPPRPDLAAALDRLDAPGALREADREWARGARDAALFRAASRAYAMLALETPGGNQASDAILARSLAALAYARALGAEDPKREACLLADVMGYSAAATELAQALPGRDPLRLYVTWDDPRLERLAAAALDPHATAGATPSLEAPFFDLLRLTSRGDYEAWFALLSRLVRPGVPVDLLFARGLENPRPEPSRLVAEQVLGSLAPPAAHAKAGRRAKPPKATAPANLAQHVQRIESALERQPRAGGGPFFAADLALAQQRAVLYTALDRIAQSSLERLPAADVSRWFAPAPKKARAGRQAAGFERWYAHLAQADLGRPDLAALRADVDSAAPGPEAALRSYEALRPVLVADDGGLRVSARDLASRLDSRPEQRAMLAAVAERDLLALNLAERLRASAGTQDAAEPPAAGPSPPDSVVGATLARQLAAHPSVWEPAQRYAAWLEQHQSYDAARRVIERWRAHSPEDTGRTPIGMDARVQLAHLAQLEGHPEEGLRILGDLYSSGYFPALERTALIDQDLGRTNQALAIAWAAHRGNPQLAAARALLAELFWLQGRHDEAAKALAGGKPELPAAAWQREVAPRFVACFTGKDSDGLAAIDALLRAGVHERATIGAIPDALGDAGLHQFAFEAQSRLRPPGAAQVESSLLAYGHLAAAKGQPAALAWLQGRVPERDREALAILAYQEGHPELLWSMAPARMAGERGDYQWLLRAATCMAAGTRDPHYAETVDHVDHSRGSYHLEIARYLLGLGEQADVLSLGKEPRQRAEIDYFVGLKNEENGHTREAADWYLMSVEAGGAATIESRWAMQRLRLWASQGRPADRSAAPAPPGAQAQPA